MVVIQRFQLLDIHQHDRNIQILHRGKHIVGGGVREELHHHNVHIGCTEFIAGRLRQLLGRDQTAVHDLHRVGQRLLKRFILSLEFRHQRGELG